MSGRGMGKAKAWRFKKKMCLGNFSVSRRIAGWEPGCQGQEEVRKEYW